MLQGLILIPWIEILFPFCVLLEETGLSVCLVTDPVVLPTAPGGHTRAGAANLSDPCMSMSWSTLPHLNLHPVCTLQAALKNNLEFCSNQWEAHKKTLKNKLQHAPVPLCHRSCRNLTLFLCHSLNSDLINQDQTISQAMHLFHWMAEYKCSNSLWWWCLITECETRLKQNVTFNYTILWQFTVKPEALSGPCKCLPHSW